MTTLAQRFWAKVNKTEACWLWTGTTADGGYGRIKVNGQMVRAHRLTHEWFNGPIPAGYQVDHLCRVRACVNPEHLEAVTPTENVLRSEAPAAVNLRKTECNRGHELSGPNLKVEADGHRRCRECRRIQDANRWPRRKVQRQAARSAA